MGQPIAHGYPDWNRQFAAAQTLLDFHFNETINAPVTSPVLTTVSMHSINLRATVTAQNLTIELDWFLDQALTQPLTTDVCVMRQGCTVDQTVTVKGPFLSVTYTPSGGAGSTFAASVFEATSSSVPHSNNGGQQLLSIPGVPLAAGATRTDPFLLIYAGPVSFHGAFDAAAAWDIRLESLDIAGTATVIDRHTNASGDWTTQTYLPWRQCRVVSHNGDGVARDLWVSVNGKPLYP